MQVHEGSYTRHTNCWLPLCMLTGAKFRPADRQIAVRIVPLLVDADVKWAVHGLQLQAKVWCGQTRAVVGAPQRVRAENTVENRQVGPVLPAMRARGGAPPVVMQQAAACRKHAWYSSASTSIWLNMESR